MGACLSRLQSKLIYNWDHGIYVKVTYKIYGVIHSVSLMRYFIYDVFLHGKVTDTMQNHWTMKQRSQ